MVFFWSSGIFRASSSILTPSFVSVFLAYANDLQ